MATSEGIPSSIDIEFLELNDNPYCISVALTTICMFCYIEVGSDKGWPRAESWHNCLHTHGHFDFFTD